MIKIVAKMRVKADRIQEYKDTARDLVLASRAEEGNISYSLNQSAADPCIFAFLEVWKDQDAIDLHNETAHFTGILPRLGELTEEGFPVEFYQEVEY